jgi:hypothetical protein
MKDGIKPLGFFALISPVGPERSGRFFLSFWYCFWNYSDVRVQQEALRAVDKVTSQFGMTRICDMSRLDCFHTSASSDDKGAGNADIMESVPGSLCNLAVADSYPRKRILACHAVISLALTQVRLG